MNLSTVRNIYNPVGKVKFNELMRHDRVYKRTPKSIAKKTVDKVAKLIKTNRKVTREYLFKHLELSKTTTEAAVRVIFESGLIRKEKNKMLPNNPVVYVWNN
jgi:predicted HTH transcriptional regulator